MMRYFLAIIAFNLFICHLYGQNEKLLYGKILSINDGIGIINTYIINYSNKSEAKTNDKGIFKILYRENDTLIIHSPLIKTQYIILSPNITKSDTIKINVQLLSIELEEVIINRQNISAESLGIISKGIKKYSPAQRRYRSGSRLTPDILLNNVLVNGQNMGNVVGVGIPIDGIINLVNGNSKLLKKHIKQEEKEMLLIEVHDIIPASDIINIYKIPEINIQGFYYYLIDDEYFIEILKSRNYSTAKFIANDLARQYIKMLNLNTDSN